MDGSLKVDLKFVLEEAVDDDCFGRGCGLIEFDAKFGVSSIIHPIISIHVG